jgi:hypothetical protein
MYLTQEGFNKMARDVFDAIIRIRRGSYQEWYNANPVLELGEISYILSGKDTGKFKVGDGETRWRNLPNNKADFPEDLLTLTDANPSNALPNKGKVEQLFQQIRDFLKWVKNLFDIDLGHKHNGEDSPKIAVQDLQGIEALAQDINSRIPKNTKAAPNGVATLDESGQIPANQLPNLGQGISAVVTNNSLQGNGTLQNPLQIKPLDSAIIYSTQDNLENDLRALYRGTWKKITPPIPIQAGEAQNASLKGSTGQTISVDTPGKTATVTVSATYNNNNNNNGSNSIDTTNGITITNQEYRKVTIGYTACQSNNAITLRSSFKGTIETLNYVATGYFNSVDVVPGEILYVDFTGRFLITYSWVGYVVPYSITLVSSKRGELQTIGNLLGSGNISFSSVILTEDEILSARINQGTFTVKWEWVYRYTRYEYVRIGE